MADNTTEQNQPTTVADSAEQGQSAAMIGNDAEQNHPLVTDPPPIEKKPAWLCSALLKKIGTVVMAISLLFVLFSYALSLGYREDASKIPSFRLSLLKAPEIVIERQDNKQPDIQSPLDNTVVLTQQTSDKNNEPDRQIQKEKASKNSPLTHNDFNILNRRNGKHTALNIIDPLPVMMISHLGNKIPIISKDGDIPWKVYAKPFDKRKNKNKIKLAVLISYAGLDENLTQKIIDAFDENVSVSFSPYAKNLKEQVEKARTAGKETYINIPLAMNKGDPGPYGMMEELTSDENFSRLTKAIGQGVAVSGILNIIEKGQSSLPENRIRKLISQANQHGLIYIGPEKPLDGENAITFDDNLFTDLNRPNIRRQLESFLAKAKAKGTGILIVDSKPSALAETLDFMDSLALNDNIVFVPISALLKETERLGS